MTLTDYCDRVVINYDFPTGVEDYVHRIGRTGRAGATGVAYTFFGDQDAKYASELMKVLEGANQRVPPQIRDMASRSGGMGRPRRWDSGYGGRDGGRSGRSDSGYGGRDGGRGGFGMSTSSSGRGGGRGYDYESRNRYDRGRSRSRSPDRGSGRGDRANNLSRDRSRSPPVRRNSPIQSFHQAMMERGRSSPPQKGQHLPAQQSPRHERSRSPYSEAGGRDSHGAARRGWGVSSSSHFGEEEEEGMIRGDGDNMIPHDNGDSYQGAD